jgi:hypothetical protein
MKMLQDSVDKFLDTARLYQRAFSFAKLFIYLLKKSAKRNPSARLLVKWKIKKIVATYFFYINIIKNRN